MTNSSVTVLDHVCVLDNNIRNCYASVAERISDMPLYNDQLSVDVVALQQIDSRHLKAELQSVPLFMAVLITPWCMNVVVIPVAENVSNFLPAVGSTWLIDIAGSEFEFTVAPDIGFGAFASASLISMMHQFETMAHAQDFAKQSLELLLTPEVKNTSEQTNDTDAVVSSDKDGAITTNEQVKQADTRQSDQLSRRQFFRKFIPAVK
ncbi:hypothetical protein MAH1_05130 [Sessilibacter sp. MAH1]